MKIITSVSIFFFCISTHARVYDGPITSSLGGAGRAGISSSEAAFINPASIILIKDHEANFLYRDGYKAEGQHRTGWALGAVDNSKEVYFPGSFHYGRTRDTGRAGAPVNGEFFHGALAYTVKDRAAFGVSGYQLKSDVRDSRSYTQMNYSLGALLLINEDFAVAYVLDNLAKPGSETPPGLREDMEQGAGLFYRAAEMMTVRFDVTRKERFNPDKKMSYMMGVESANSEWMVVRFGFRRDELSDQKVWAAGVAFNGPRLKVDYSVEKNQEGTSGALHSVDMRVPF